MIAALIIIGLLITVTIVIMLCFNFGELISGYKRFQKRDDSLGYAVIDYFTYKRLYQVNPDAYDLTGYGQLYRLTNEQDWTTREVRILFKSFKDYCQFIIDRNAKKKADKILERHQQETAGLDKLRQLAQKDIDKLRAKLDEEFKQEQKKNEKIKTNMQRPVGNLTPLVQIDGQIKCYWGQPVYIDEMGNYFTKEGTPLPMKGE